MIQYSTFITSHFKAHQQSSPDGMSLLFDMFLFHGIIFYSWCLCTSTKYDHHWKKQDFWLVSELYAHFCSLKHPYFFCFSNEQIGHSISQLNHILVGGFNPSEKYESQLGWLFPIYGKIKIMFQTTNQHFFLLESSQFMSNPKKNMQLESPRYLLGGPWLVSCNASTGGSRSTGHQGTPPTRSGK